MHFSSVLTPKKNFLYLNSYLKGFFLFSFYTKFSAVSRMNRSIQSEGAFAVVKQNYGFRQFLLRGHKKVSTEVLILAMAYNINKLHAKIQQDRTGTQLFEKDSA